MARIKQPENPRQAAEFVADRLRAAGRQALFAGGCVRDLLMGREPADYDVATDAAPAAVCRLFRRTLTVGAQFGVVIVLVGPFQVEVATFRSDGGYADGRHPDQVRYSDARQDAARRDFTINGMFLDPGSGAVIDYVGGRTDLAARVVRAIGEPAERFAEDHLRMLRAVRFACVLGFALEERTAEAIRRHAGRIGAVSAERIWQEWEKLLAHPNRSAGWELGMRTGLVAALWPDLVSGAEAIGQRLARLEWGADATTALACQLLDLPVEQVHARCRDLAMDNRRRLDVAWLVERRGVLLDGPLDIVPLKKLMADANWPRLVALSRAIVSDPQGPSRNAPNSEGGMRSAELRSSEFRVPSSEFLDANLLLATSVPPDQIAPPPLIDGEDVMALGIEQGPRVGRLLSAAYDAQLAGQVRTREQALALVRRLMMMDAGC